MGRNWQTMESLFMNVHSKYYKVWRSLKISQKVLENRKNQKFLLPLHFIKNFSENFPDTKLNLFFDVLSEAERKVLAKESQVGIKHYLTGPNFFEVFQFTSVKMIPVISLELYKQRKVKRQSDLLGIEQIVVSDKSGSKRTSFGLFWMKGKSGESQIQILKEILS